MYLNSVNSSCAPVPGASPGVAVAIDVNRYVPRPGRDKLFVQMPRGGGSAMFYFLRVSFYFQWIQTRSTGPVACKTGVSFLRIFPSHATRASRSPRFRLCSPEIRKKLRLFCRLGLTMLINGAAIQFVVSILLIFPQKSSRLIAYLLKDCNKRKLLLPAST